MTIKKRWARTAVLGMLTMALLMGSVHVDTASAAVGSNGFTVVGLDTDRVTPGMNNWAYNFRVSHIVHESGYLTYRVYDSENKLVHSSREYHTPKTTVWTWNPDVPNGQYRYEIEMEDNAGNKTPAVSGTVTVDRNPALVRVDAVRYAPYDETLYRSYFTIPYTLYKSANVTMRIYDHHQKLVRTLANGESQAVGERSLVWNHRDDAGKLMGAGHYRYELEVIDTVTEQPVVIHGTLRMEGEQPTASLTSMNPVAFVRAERSSIALPYRLYNTQGAADVLIRIYDRNRKLVKTLANQENQPDGTYSVEWDGKNEAGEQAPVGTYIYRVDPRHPVMGFGGASEGSIELLNTLAPGQQQVRDVRVAPAPAIAAEGQDLAFYFNLAKDGYAQITIRDDKDEIVHTLNDTEIRTAGLNQLKWNLKNLGDRLVKPGVYKYTISAVDAAKRNTSYDIKGSFAVIGEPTYPVISSASLDRNYLFPTGTNNVLITYTLTEKSTVTIGAYDSKTNMLITSFAQGEMGPGRHEVKWNGKMDLRTNLRDGTYVIKINGRSASGKLAAEMNAGEIVIDNTMAKVSGTTDVNHFFLERGKNFKMNYQLNEESKVNIKIMQGQTVIKEVTSSQLTPAGTYTFAWDGKNQTGELVRTGDYTCVFELTNAGGEKVTQSLGKVTVVLKKPTLGWRGLQK